MQVSEEYYYSTVNSEIDWPEFGKSGNFNSPMLNIYRSEVEATYLTNDLSGIVE
jgi:hypothetical protein